MPGPPPSRNPRRRNARPDWRQLPASGRPGETPDWPLDEQLPGESGLWRELWASPQAVAWEDFGWGRSVARYVRCTLQAERPDASAAILAEVRQLEDRLGLNPLAMKRLMWEIVEAPADDGAGDIADLSDFRDRLGG